ncbi:putative oxidoreductase [Filimonas zeae]|uniref:Ketoreductase domain-containing protein n=1 Tax=Filimonas zeae TaxID=1737353 RepID=A0A917IY53_9BACT|nr:SDR family NAD(P)-dependent oxidoreductase [Filimonas zeae]MDR6338661.1 putative oxidoreductase [Filimonas zeae]GGH67180.1 hypothetical protein GCM10011379_22160 [Filimonas zeae]
MNITGKTILITGGGSGIGLETARLFAQQGNTIIITGRNREKLERAAATIGNAAYYSCDVTSEADVLQLKDAITNRFGKLDILMNNAGLAYLHNLSNTTDSYAYAAGEITTNYLSTIRLISLFLPLLQQQQQSAIINISSIAAFTPAFSLPTYSASKAALHAYTQSLRYSLGLVSQVKVFEVMPSLVDTEFARDIPTTNKLSALEVAEAIIQGVKDDVYEMHVGETEQLYQHFFSNSTQAFQVLNHIG